MSGHFLKDLQTSFGGRSAHAALVHQGGKLTYGKIDERARRCAAWLQE